MQMQTFPTLILAQGGNSGATAGAAPALVPLGVPTPAKTTAVEGQPLPTTAPGGAASRPAGGLDSMMFIILPALGLMLFMMWNTSRSEKKKRAELNNSIKKGDTVQMLGGIIGVVTEIRDDEVVVKMEEGKIRFARSAVQGILKSTRDSKAEAAVEPKMASVGAGTR